MVKGRTQLNINIDPDLLLLLKSEAIKSGKTLTDFVTDQLKKVPQKPLEETASLEARLRRIETTLGLENQSVPQANEMGSIFTDEGAKLYGEVAKAEFELHMKKMKISLSDALEEVSRHLKNYPHANPELVFQILLGTHQLTGAEMTTAYRNGSCAMRSALHDWTNNSLEALNDAFLNAVITKSLA